MKISLKSLVIFIFIFILGVAMCSIGYKLFLSSIYPTKYDIIVKDVSQEYNIKPELIYAVIKAESNFNENAESSAGARGLMQITPDTFEWLQGYTNDSHMDKDALYNPDVNIRYGALFLSLLSKKYYQSDDLVLCAYNAGINAVERWLKDDRFSNNGEELKVIPYKETENYVDKIKKYKEIYKSLYF